jgi:hypothetical protein
MHIFTRVTPVQNCLCTKVAYISHRISTVQHWQKHDCPAVPCKSQSACPEILILDRAAMFQTYIELKCLLTVPHQEDSV